MAYDGTTWNETIPDNDTVANTVDDHIQDIKKGISGRMAVEHIWPTSQTATGQAGFHKFITFQAQTAAPTMATASSQVGAIWVKSSGLGLWSTDSAAIDRALCFLSTAVQTHAGLVSMATTGTTSAALVTYAQFSASNATLGVKGWCSFDGSSAEGAITAAASYNVSGIVKNASGIYTISWATDFGSANYAVSLTPADEGFSCSIISKAAGTIQVYCNNGGGSKADSKIDAIAFGDQ